MIDHEYLMRDFFSYLNSISESFNSFGKKEDNKLILSERSMIHLNSNNIYDLESLLKSEFDFTKLSSDSKEMLTFMLYKDEEI